MRQALNILMLAAEAAPFCPASDLADAVGGLAQSLRKSGHDVRLVLPRHRCVSSKNVDLKRLPWALSLPLGDGIESVSLWEGRGPGGATAIFLDSPKYFDRGGVYHEEGGEDYPDNDERFILLCRGALEAAKAVDFRPDIVHGQDWPGALACAYLDTVYRTDAFFLPTASVFTVYKTLFQGLFPRNTFYAAGFPLSEFTPDRLEYYGQFNFTKAALVCAQKIAIPSAADLWAVQMDPAAGHGLEGVFQKRTADLEEVSKGAPAYENLYRSALKSKLGT